MRNAKLIVGAAIATMAVGACHSQQQQQVQGQNLAIDQGVPDNQIAGNADIETLPSDESSTTPSNQLANGFDNPDVNEAGNSANSF